MASAVGTLIGGVANHSVRFVIWLFTTLPSAIGRLLVFVLQRVVAPTLLLCAAVGIQMMSQAPDPRQTLEAAPRIEQPFETTVMPVVPVTEDDRLARFHANAQVFENEADAAEGLADALNIPVTVVAADLNRAIGLVDTNTKAMRAYAGTFPLPRDINPRLLAALTPSDIPHLAALFDYALTIGQDRFSFSAPMASGELNVEADITKLPNNCLTAIMFFTRRSFGHVLTSSGCRRGDKWSFLATPERKTP